MPVRGIIVERPLATALMVRSSIGASDQAGRLEVRVREAHDRVPVPLAKRTMGSEAGPCQRDSRTQGNKFWTRNEVRRLESINQPRLEQGICT